jgi:hypothetical protein
MTLSPRDDAVEELLALLGTLRLDDFAAGEDDVFAVVVDLDDLEFEDLADVFVEILRRDDVDLGAGEEGFDADVDHEATFDDGFDLAFDESAIAEHGGDFFPVLFVISNYKLYLRFLGKSLSSQSEPYRQKENHNSIQL